MKNQKMTICEKLDRMSDLSQMIKMARAGVIILENCEIDDLSLQYEILADEVRQETN